MLPTWHMKKDIQVSKLASLFSCREFAVDSRQTELKEIFASQSLRLVTL